MKLSRWACVSAVLLALLLSPLVSAAVSGPRIRFDRTSIDYGKVPVGKIVAPRFVYKNIGDAPLKITTPLWRDRFLRTKALEGC